MIASLPLNAVNGTVISRCTKKVARKRPLPFDPQTFLAKFGGGKTNLNVPKKHTIFAQGDAAEAVFYLQAGRIKLTVVSKRGKEAVVAILRRGSFLGEGCLGGETVRVATATALEDSSLVRIDKEAMIRMLSEDRTFSELFIAYLLAHTQRVEQALVDHLFSSSEMRLARVLLLMAHFGKEDKPEEVITKLSQETLAEMVGTTRSRVSYFMNKFRKLGFIDYNGTLRVHSALLNVVLND